LPAGSKTSTGGAAAQHSPTLSSSARSFACSVAAPRWMIQTWSWSSTQTPIAMPITQWFGSGLGHSGIDLEAWALDRAVLRSAWFCRDRLPDPRASARDVAAKTTLRRVRDMAGLPGVSGIVCPQ
jgi:hypothetical protein